MRIAHISDLHFSKITINPLQFSSKRWIGNMNLLFFRRKEHKVENLNSLPDLFQELGVDLVIVAGDISTTSLDKEFKKAQALFKKFEEKGISLLYLPGNHDRYTKKSDRKKTFYNYFENETEHAFSLKEHRVEIHRLIENWWCIVLDTALATPLHTSHGIFSEEIENNLLQVLKEIPNGDSVMLANHFPFITNDDSKRALQRADILEKIILDHPQIKFYLHGHTHRHCIADLRPSKLPIILDSGSISHMKHGTWNLLDLSKDGCQVSVFHSKPKPWQKRQEIHFEI